MLVFSVSAWVVEHDNIQYVSTLQAQQEIGRVKEMKKRVPQAGHVTHWWILQEAVTTQIKMPQIS